MSKKIFIPWRIKLFLKLILSRLPIQYSTFKYLGIFVHGQMNNINYAERTFLRHFKNFDELRNHRDRTENWTGLEFGPGDSIISGMLAASYGAKVTYLIDVGAFATRNMALYRELDQQLSKKAGTPQRLDDRSKFEDVLERYNIVYLTDGLRSLDKISDKAIDFAWSQSVLEHVRIGDFLKQFLQLYRCMKIGSISSHGVDLKDHFNGGINNLRFSTNIWESDFFADAGFYTNRLRISQMIELFDKAGFDTRITRQVKWNIIPINRQYLASEFSGLSVDDLETCYFEAILEKRSNEEIRVAEIT